MQEKSWRRSRKLLVIRERVLGELRKLAREVNGVVYLFGSMSRGDHRLDSDVDIVVVSKTFHGMRLEDRVAVVRAMLPEDIGFDIIALTPEEFAEKKQKAFFREVSRYWVEIEP